MARDYRKGVCLSQRTPMVDFGHVRLHIRQHTAEGATLLSVISDSKKDLDPKRFHRHLEALLDRAVGRGGVRSFAERLISRIQEELGVALGLAFSQLYRRSGSAIALVKTWGDAPDLSRELNELFASQDGVVELPWAGKTSAQVVALLPVGDDG